MGRNLFRRGLALFASLIVFAATTIPAEGETLKEIQSEKQEAQNKKNEAESNLGSVNKYIVNISE